jgi:hypothetical protein
MYFVGLDLAERHSAAVCLSSDLVVERESFIDSGPAQKQEHPWKRLAAYREWVGRLWAEVDRTACGEGIRVVIEEPYPHAVNVAPSYRMQGGILAELQDMGVTESQVTITKSKPWQDHFGYTKKEFGNSKAWAKLMCDGFGYEPGETVTDRKVLAKPKEDLRDAYLLARWLKEILT